MMSDHDRQPFQTTRWLIFGILALAYFLVYFHRLSLSVVADDLIREMQTTAGLMGLLGSMYFYCYALMQIPAGLLSDSFGPRKTVTCSLILAAAGSVLFGLAPGIRMAFVGRILVGFGVSAVFIPTMKILSQWFQAKEFASMAGLISDRVLHSRKKVIVLCSSLLLVLFFFLSRFPAGLPQPLLYVLFFLFSLCSSSIVAIGFTTTKELFPVEIAGTSVGLVNFFPFLGGAIFMPLLGKVLDRYPINAQGDYAIEGYSAVLSILFAAALAALICSLLMKETFPAEET